MPRGAPQLRAFEILVVGGGWVGAALREPQAGAARFGLLTAGSPADAEKLLQARRRTGAGDPDGVVVEANATAEETLRAVENLGKVWRLPLVVVGDGPATPSVRELVRAGAHAYLSREWLSSKSLGQALEEAIERTALEREAAAERAGLMVADERFRHFAEHSAAVLWMTDPKAGRIVYASPSFEGVWGFPVEELLTGGYPRWAATLHPEDSAWVRGLVEEVQRVGAARAEYRIFRPDGTMRWIRDHGFTIRQSPDGLIGGVAEDVTELKLAAEQQRASEARFRALVEATSDAVWSRGADGRFTPESLELWERLTGQPRAEALGEDGWGWLLMVHPEDREGARARWARSLEERTPLDSEYRLRMRESGYRWMRATGVPVARREGLEWVGTLKDVTVEREAAAALAASDAATKAALAEIEWIYASAPIGMCLLDRELRWVRINERLAEMNGLPAAAHIGRRVRELLPSIADVAEGIFREIFRTGEPRLDVEIVGETPREPGVVRSWNESFLPMRDAAGNVVAVSVVCAETTELKRARRALTESEERFRLATEAMTGIVYEYDIASGRVWRSDGLKGTLGFDPAEVPATAEWWFSRTHPEDAARTAAEFARAVGEGRPSVVMEYRVRHADGRYVWLLDHARLAYDGSGAAARLVGCTVSVDARKRAEQALAASEARVRAMLDQAAVGVVVWDAAGRIQEANPGFCRIVGRSREQLRRMSMADLAHAEHPLPAGDAAGGRPAVAAGGATTEQRLVRGDGSALWARITSTPLAEEAGQPASWIGIAEDVTARREAEASLEESRERLALAQLAGAVGLFDWDLNTGRIAWTQEMEALYGLPPGSFEGTAAAWASRLAPEHRGWLAELAGAGGGSGAPGRAQREVELRIHRPDGSERWLLSRWRLVGGAGGTGGLPRVVGTNVDITDRKAWEGMLSDERNRLHLALQTGRMGTWDWNLEDGSVSWSEGTYALLGYQPHSFQPTVADWRARVHPEDLARVERVGEASLTTGLEYTAEYRVCPPGGPARWVEVRGRVDAVGRARRMYGVLSDVNDRKLAEDELVRHRHHLEELVAARSEELERAHAALRLRERMAAMGQLAAGLAHDLNNLLMPLRALVEALLREDGLSERARHDLATLQGVAAYLTSLSRGLRLFSRDPAQPGESETTDAAPWCADARAFLRASLPQGVELVCDVHPATPRMAIAPHRLSQAVQNLVQNAADALRQIDGEQARGTVRVEVAPAGEGGVRVSVVDSGPGMSEDVRRRCLEPFFTTKARGRGTGLGLSIMHGIISAAGGSVDIRTQPGHGCRFELTLPAAKATGPGGGAKGRAVVGLEDRRARAFVRSLLEGLGHQIVGEDPQPGTALWVVEAARTEPGAVAAFLSGGMEGERAAVVIGGGAEAWTGTRATVVPPGAALADLRPVLRQASQSLIAGGTKGSAN